MTSDLFAHAGIHFSTIVGSGCKFTARESRWKEKAILTWTKKCSVLTTWKTVLRQTEGGDDGQDVVMQKESLPLYL